MGVNFFDFDSAYLLTSLLVILAIQFLFFIIASILRSDVLTDITYALTFLVIVLLVLSFREVIQVTHLVLTAMVVLWALRLGVYLLVRILHMGRDERFDGIREKPLRFLVFWTFQGISIWLILWPSLFALTDGRGADWGLVRTAGVLVWLLGLVLESIADLQKYRFRSAPENKGLFIHSGLYRHARHPNFLGEMLCWWGVFLVALPALEGWQWVAILGPLFLTLLLRFGTGVPTVSRKQGQKYGHLPEFEHYLKNSNMFIPLPLFRARSA